MTNSIPDPFNIRGASLARLKSIPNKWAVASLLAFVYGMVLLFFIGLIYAAVIILPNPVTGDQAGWNVLAFIILPFVAIQKYLVLVALVSLVLGVISIVKAKGRRNVLGIVMSIISGLIALQLPTFLSMTLGIGR